MLQTKHCCRNGNSAHLDKFNLCAQRPKGNQKVWYLICAAFPGSLYHSQRHEKTCTGSLQEVKGFSRLCFQTAYHRAGFARAPCFRSKVRSQDTFYSNFQSASLLVGLFSKVLVTIFPGVYWSQNFKTVISYIGHRILKVEVNCSVDMCMLAWAYLVTRVDKGHCITISNSSKIIFLKKQSQELFQPKIYTHLRLSLLYVKVFSVLFQLKILKGGV